MKAIFDVDGVTGATSIKDWRGVRPISPNWEAFEWTFGCVLPIVCFTVERGMNLFGTYDGLVLTFVGVEILLFAYWKLCPARSERASALIAGALALGACFAGLVGIVLSPISAVALIVGIGVLGFVPIGTAIAYGRVASRTFEYAAPDRDRLARVLFASGAIALSAPFAAAWGARTWIVDSTLARLERGDADCVHDSIERLNALPWFDEDCLVNAYGDIDDDGARERISFVYESLTGNSIQERLELLND